MYIYIYMYVYMYKYNVYTYIICIYIYLYMYVCKCVLCCWFNNPSFSVVFIPIYLDKIIEPEIRK